MLDRKNTTETNKRFLVSGMLTVEMETIVEAQSEEEALQIAEARQIYAWYGDEETEWVGDAGEPIEVKYADEIEPDVDEDAA